MIQSVKAVDINNGVVVLRKSSIEEIRITDDAIITVDGSTDTTGISIVRKRDKMPLYIAAFSREKKDETPVQFKVRLKKEFYKLIIRNKIINSAYYEEPFIGYASAIPNLMMLRTFIEELIAENDPELTYLKHAEINNKKWKKVLLAPDKCPTGTELEKAAVRNRILELYPTFTDLTQDEMDSLGMAIAIISMINDGQEDELASKKKARPFQYNIQFIGAEEDSIAFQEFYDVYNGPTKLLDNGLQFAEIGGRGNFNKQVYELMGQSDQVLIVKFSSKHHGNLVLEHRVGGLATSYPFLYAIIWRKTRK